GGIRDATVTGVQTCALPILYLALKQLFPTGRRFPFFTVISMVSVALGVALLIVVLSVMGGFGYELRRVVVEMEGEIQIRSSALRSEERRVGKESRGRWRVVE